MKKYAKRKLWALLTAMMLLLALPAMAEEETHIDLAPFTGRLLDGTKTDESLWANADLTMVTVWQTTCNPCIEEMPALQKLYEKGAEKGFQVVGIALDTLDLAGKYDKDQIQAARDVLESLGVTFPNLAPSQDLIDAFLGDVFATPSAIFVDKNGHQVGKMIVGPATYGQWAKLATKHLKTVQ